MYIIREREKNDFERDKMRDYQGEIGIPP
jgi:hypothetical protein